MTHSATVGRKPKALRTRTKKRDPLRRPANRVADEFLKIMAHELRTPLSLIIGHAGLIEEGYLGRLTQDQKKSLRQILKSSGDLVALVTKMSQAAGVDAAELKPETVSLGNLLKELKQQLALPQDKAVELIWDCPENVPPMKTDGEKLKHVLAHLIDNALKFTEQGHVIVSMRHSQQRKQVEFRIADTGMGIAAEAVPTLFENIGQLDSSTTRRYGGAGLGLYVARKFSELLGGRLTVASRPGIGSTFRVALPLEA